MLGLAYSNNSLYEKYSFRNVPSGLVLLACFDYSVWAGKSSNTDVGTWKKMLSKARKDKENISKAAHNCSQPILLSDGQKEACSYPHYLFQGS